MVLLRDAVNIVSDKEKLLRWITKHKSSLQAWTLFCVAVFAMYHLFSDGDFSFLMTLSSLVSTFSFLMVVYNIEAAHSATGVSLRMMELYLFLICARLFAIVPFEGYLPYDRSGDWMYQTVEAVGLCLAGTVVYQCRGRFRETYEKTADSFPHLILAVIALALALVIHPSLNAYWPADVAWSFALYLEAGCVLPQLFMFQREKKVEPFTTHFLAGQALAKALSFAFWISSYSELNASHGIKSYVGMWVIAMQVLQLIVMGDFIFHYIRCMSKGVPVQFLLTENV